MTEPSQHIHYSFEDIQRYLQGKMPAAEMHDIEKAALQDPFLADAIEGFQDVNLTTAQQHLNEINASLLKEKKESKVVAFNKRTQWLNVAAIIIVLAGVGVVASYFLKSSDQQTKVAQVKNEPAKINVPKDSVTGSMSTLSKKPDTTLFIAENKPSKKTEPLKLRKAVSEKDVTANKALEEDNTDVASIAAPVPLNQNTESPVMDTVLFNMKTTKLNKNTDSTQVVALQGKALGFAVIPSTFSGKVLDQNGEPVPFATLQSNRKQAIATDAEGNFTLKGNNDSVLTITASAVGYITTTSSIQPGRSNLIVLPTNNPAANEMVVTTALGVARKAKSQADSAMPVGGWKNFNTYVTQQLNKDTTAESVTNPEDIVEVEFLIDNMGNPYDFKVVKPLDDQRNAKAIEILKEGPKWTNTSKKKKAKVAINF